MRYAIVIESGPNNYSAYVPDLPGCVATGQSVDEVRDNLRQAIVMHLEGLRADGEPIQQPSTATEYLEIEAA
ncbi:MAG: type II toxin-antitoxin system HicB family antitoxin [Phycisphaeraceae bacterium]|nr:type II toxin-antitoxin system HicB family antitoxin [Phycisphaeraceae bacterium]